MAQSLAMTSKGSSKTAWVPSFHAALRARRPRIRHWFPDIATVGRYGERDVRERLADDGVIRHEGKVRACIADAASAGWARRGLDAASRFVLASPR